MWEDCLWNFVFPTLDRASHMVGSSAVKDTLRLLVYCVNGLQGFCLQAATSSKDEWQGKELGIRGGKAVHMLIHHR